MAFLVDNALRSSQIPRGETGFLYEGAFYEFTQILLSLDYSAVRCSIADHVSISDKLLEYRHGKR